MKTVAAAIEFGTSKIVTLLAESGGFTRCEIVGSGTVPYAGYSEACWNDPDGVLPAIEASIHAAEVEAKRSIHEIYVGVPGECILVRTAIGEVDIASPDGRVSAEDITNVMDAAADVLGLDALGGNVLHRSPAWFTVDNGKRTMQPMNVHLRGNKLQAMVSFILADPAFIDDVRVWMGELGITINAFLAPSMGMSLLLMSFDERDRTPVVLLDVGYLNTEFSVIEGDAITYHAVIPMGGGHITAGLAEALEIGMDDAEDIKRRFSFSPDEFEMQSDPEVRFEDGSVVTFPREFVDDTVKGVADELIEMIQMVLQHAAGRIAARSQIYLTGGGLVNMHGGKEYLAEKLERGVKIPVVRAARLNNPRFSSALGLMDLVFESVEHQTVIEEDRSEKAGGLKNKLFRRTPNA